ncbi:hypothetical protein HNY73_012068 [Argiope bruennichi]|uniref:DUF7041 domain-containing protein n=1 Tax=Argiope bruennichi TaxID=94029 RepID=A0A8T0EYI2_ARGBR|nr:hypothetical protein HNY73_012068 [Argiope bruennichi]
MQNEASRNIARVAVKAPPFWRGNLELWFKHMESQFILADVTTEITKFHHIVPVLQPEELEVVGDIMQHPPAKRPYEALRRRLCSQYAQSEEQKLKDVISRMQLGDRKRSRLLVEMRNKAGNEISEEMAEEQQTDPELREILSSNATSLVLQPLPVSEPLVTLHCDVSLGHIRPFVLENFRLKAAIMEHGKVQWSLALPTILLRFRATWKEDLEATTADMLYSIPIRLPGEFLSPPVDSPDPSNF